MDQRQLLPSTFCWTKMGSEAGQPLTAILRRKELERASGAGAFAWGIGNSLGSGLTQLLQLDRAPAVIFSEMRAKPKAIDANANRILLWLSFVSPHGEINPLPEHVVVTSRAILGGDAVKARHYALFCFSSAPLHQAPTGEICLGQLRNLESGKPLGFSQVTSLVERYDSGTLAGPLYPITFRARLTWPYFARLANPILLSERWVADLRRFSIGDRDRNASDWRRWASSMKKEAMRSLIHDREQISQLSLPV